MTTSLTKRSHQYEPKSPSVISEMCKLYSPRVLSPIILSLYRSSVIICNPSDIILFSRRHIELLLFVTLLHVNMTSLPISVYSVTSSWTLSWMVPKIKGIVFNVLLSLKMWRLLIILEVKWKQFVNYMISSFNSVKKGAIDKTKHVDILIYWYSREATHRFRTSNNAKSNPEIKGRNSIFLDMTLYKWAAMHCLRRHPICFYWISS